MASAKTTEKIEEVKTAVPPAANGTPPSTAEVTLDNLEASGQYEDEQVGFPPYWNPKMYCTACTGDDVIPGDPGRELEEKEYKCKKHGDTALRGSRFFGRVINKDDEQKIKDSKTGEMKPWIRWVLQATKFDIPCEQGKSDAQERMIVKCGEFFTMSEYASLPLERFFGLEVVGIVKGKRPIDGGKTLWSFRVMVDKDTKAILTDGRKQLADQARAMFAEQGKRLLAAKVAKTAIPEGELVAAEAE
jgi:hypothetical protein